MDHREKYYVGLNSPSPLTGREVLLAGDIGKFFSENSLHFYRALVEVENLIALSESNMPNKPLISDREKDYIRRVLIRDFRSSAVADYDHFGRNGKGPFEHDVKSVEVHLREVFEKKGLGRFNEMIHFPMTSEDVNNLAYNMMLRDGINNVWLPKVLEVGDKLSDLAEKYSYTQVIGKTHGMNASPTTIGKRFGYSLDKLVTSLETLKGRRLDGKFSGPVGNHNAMAAVLPEFDFQGYAKKFVEGLGFDYSSVENQRISHQAVVRLLGNIQEVNLIGEDIDENVRYSVMMGWLFLDGNKNHVGSSIMPHKVNPWSFEVGQGYFEISNSLIDGSRRGLLNTTFERDLTDHPWERMYGEMIGYSGVGLVYLSQGLDSVRVDTDKCLRDLDLSPEVLSEAVQIGGRLERVDDVYMKIKEATRGRNVSLDFLREVVRDVIPDGKIKDRLLALEPKNYVGKASEEAKYTVKRYKSLKYSLVKGVLN